jgi:hypothetical protein
MPTTVSRTHDQISEDRAWRQSRATLRTMARIWLTAIPVYVSFPLPT